MPHFYAPATGVPLDAFDGVVDRLDRHGRQQQPLNGCDVRGRLDFLDLDGPQRDRGQTFTLTMSGWTASQGKTAVPTWRPGRPVDDAALARGGVRPPVALRPWPR